MREPSSPRYALSMQHGADASSGNYHSIFDEDEDSEASGGGLNSGGGGEGVEASNANI